MEAERLEAERLEAGGPHLAVCSHRGQVVLGYNEVEISMKGSGYMFIHAADMMHCAENHTRMIKTGETGITIFRLLSKSGRWIWVQSNARMVLKAGKPDFIVARQRALTQDAAALSSLSDAAFQDSHATLSIPGDAAGNGGPARADAALQEVMSTLQDILEDGELMGALEVAPEELKGWESALLRLSGEAGADPGDVLSYFEEQLQLEVPVGAWPPPAPPAPNGAPAMAPPLSHLDFPPVAVAPQPNAVIPLAAPRRPQNQLAAAFLMPDPNGPPYAAPPPHVAAATLQGRRPNPAFSQWNGAGQNISNGFHADAAAPGLFTPALHEPPWPQRRPLTADDVIGRAPLRAPHAATPPVSYFSSLWIPLTQTKPSELPLSPQISSLGGAGFPFPLLPNGSCFSDSK
ncbi:unnamed protein product [Menidia menidia]|uniref:(Atlantic silverside) hypothetical protein n=1 Tax=Menidia menidia TaxID=238744 RepID=A0A8S4BQA8_9TELE|nr:unnamed protein product [Menidia menidia]CAG5995649.1 unnamed protein product [Menidia menidia]